MKGTAMERGLLALAVLAVLLVTACDENETAAPSPVALTEQAVGHYCGMVLAEHEGPKGQILLRGRDQPVWFSSARDTIAFTMLDEEAKAIRAIYVSDMAKAATWAQPGATNWVDARSAHFVLGSDRRSGMGAEEAVPFSDRAAADRFAIEHSGRVLAFAEVPRDWALGGGALEQAAPEAHPAPSLPRHAH